MKNKKFHIAAVLFVLLGGLFSSEDAWAQEKHYFGVKAGVNFTTGYFRNQFVRRVGFEVVSKQGVHGMAMYRYVLGKYTGLQVEAGYIEKGWKQLIEEKESFVMNLNYARFQVTSYFHLPLGNEKTQLYLNIGPFIDRLVESRYDKLPDLTNLERKGITFFTHEKDRDFDIGYGIGGSIGFERKVGPGKVIVESLISVALSRMINSGQPNRETEERITDPETGASTKVSLPNISSDYSLGVTLGYLIAIGGEKNKAK